MVADLDIRGITGALHRHPALTVLLWLRAVRPGRHFAGRYGFLQLAYALQPGRGVEVTRNGQYGVIGHIIAPVVLVEVITLDVVQVHHVSDDLVMVGTDAEGCGLYFFTEAKERFVFI